MSKLFKRAFLDTEDGQILYRIGGDGDPLLLLHQNQTSSNEYQELMPIFARDRLIVAMDFLGFGDSDKPPRMYSIEDYAKTVILLLDELGIKKTSILGNHTGAFVGGEVAIAYPERVNNLILSNPVVFGEAGQAALFRRFEQGFSIQADGSHLQERWNARINYLQSAELNHRFVLDDLKCFGYPLYAVWAVANYCMNIVERWRSIACPTLIMWGMEDMKQFEALGFWNSEDANLIAQIIPQKKVVNIEGGTICMMSEMPENISLAVLDFLNNTEFLTSQ